ncbi:MAG: sugar phosphate nucleotidyltransferase [bacterium]|nr:sugar phosphate nucleotidyltransferase [bacterium]
MKVIIPVAGIGTRLRPHTHTLPKVLMKVAGKTIIEHIVDELIKLNYRFSEIIFIVGYLGEQIQDYIKARYKGRVKLRFVYQEIRKGLAHAVYLTRDVVKNEPVFIILGDTIFKANLGPVVHSASNYIGVKEVDNPKRFGIVQTGRNGLITKFVEKPERPMSNLAIVGIYLIQDSKKLFHKIEHLIRHNIRTKGEYQLTDALQLMLKEKEKFRIFKIRKWLDCGKPETLLSTNNELLKENKFEPPFRNVLVISPNYISKSAKLRNCIIRPYVSIGNNVVVENSVIKNSLVNDGAIIRNLFLNDSLIGREASIQGVYRTLNIGDSSEVKLG